VTTKAQIDEWYASGTAGTVGIPPGINRIIFDRAKGNDWRQGGAPGPWENHETNEHLTIVAYGTAKVTIDGFITGAHWDNRGVMGKGVVGGSEDTVAPGTSYSSSAIPRISSIQFRPSSATSWSICRRVSPFGRSRSSRMGPDRIRNPTDY
jgi:hypothetical protein